SQLEKARATRFSQRPGRRFDGLQAVREAAAIARNMQLGKEAFDRLRTEAIGCLALPDVRIAQEWDGWAAGTLNVVFDDALERYARRDREGAISVRRVAGDSEIRLLPGPGPGYELFVLRFSPDGQYLAATYNPGHVLKVWHLARPEPVFAGPSSSPVFHVDFRPDSRELAFHTPADGSLFLVDLDSGRSRRLPPRATNLGWLAYHPGGRQLAMTADAKDRKTIQVRDLDSGNVIADLWQRQGRVESLAWHPDGTTLAAACDDLPLYFWYLPTPHPI